MFEGSHLLSAEDISEFLQKWRFALRKPLFYPLNYGNNDLQRINGLNCDGQERRCDAQRFFSEGFALDSRQPI